MARQQAAVTGGRCTITTKKNIDPAVFDAEVLAVVQCLIPPERVHAHLRELDRQLAQVVGLAASDPSLQSHAHKIISQAGMLGLTRMAECARALENACRSGEGREDALLQCRAAVEDIRLYAMPAAEALANPAQAPDPLQPRRASR